MGNAYFWLPSLQNIDRAIALFNVERESPAVFMVASEGIGQCECALLDDNTVFADEFETMLKRQYFVYHRDTVAHTTLLDNQQR